MIRYMTIARTLPLLFVLLLPGAGAAQSIGPRTDKTADANNPLREVVPFEGAGFVTVVVDRVENPTVVRLTLYDPDERRLADRTLSLNQDGLSGQLEGAFSWGGRLAVLTSSYAPGPKRNTLLLRLYSLPTLEEAGGVKVDEAYTPRELRIPFGYSLSADGARLLCYSWSYSLPEDPVRLSLRVLDAGLQEEWSRSYVLPYRNETFYLYGSLIDGSGHAYLLCEEYQGKPSRFANVDEGKIKQVVLYAGPELDRPREYAIRPGKLLLSGIRFALDPGDQLVGAGFYRKRGRTRYEGFITLRIDGAADRMRHQLLPLNDDRYRQAAPDGDGRGAFANYSLDYLFVQDSAIVLAGEQIVESQQRGMMPYGFRGAPSFTFQDVLVARIRQDRYLDWVVRLPREQRGDLGDLPKFSFNSFRQEGRTVVLFNNILNRGGETRGNTQLYLVGDDGRVQRQDITPVIRTHEQMTPHPARSWTLGRERLLLYGVRSEGKQASALIASIPWAELIGKTLLNNP